MATPDPRPCLVLDPSVNMRIKLLVGGGVAIEAKSSRERVKLKGGE
jgi:hypothetical protein